MGKYLDSSGVTYLWGKIKGLFTDSSLNTGAKTITGAINEINTKVNNLTGAFVWKGSFETEADKPSAATYNIGDVIGVAHKEYVCTEVNGAKTWVEFGDEANHITKDFAESTYLKNTASAVGTANLSDNAVTSAKLAVGTRNPIILTESTTEVDEETYQKLLRDDVDVVFKMNNADFLYRFTSESVGSGLMLNFSSLVAFPKKSIENVRVQGVQVTIKHTTPHTCKVFGIDSEPSLKNLIDDAKYLNKSTLTPILKEIDLTGTDAERKAKLDQFEADWKALTGSDSLDGARFVGRLPATSTGQNNVLLTYNWADGEYKGLCSDDSYVNSSVSVSTTNGSIFITPLFQHLEAVTIKTSNSDADKAANVAAIKAYVNNLKSLGVDVTKGYMVPIVVGNNVGYMTIGSGPFYRGLYLYDLDRTTWFSVSSVDGTYSRRYVDFGSPTSNLTTTSKQIVGAINEVNAAVKTKASNIKDASSTGGINQAFDGGETLDVTSKNPNATALDSTITGALTRGATGQYASSFGGKSIAMGKRSFAEGTTTIAKGNYSHAEGDNSVALGSDSHVEGYQTTTGPSAMGAHAEGNGTQSLGAASHSEGSSTIAKGNTSHAEGADTKANGVASHAEGNGTKGDGNYSHAEGNGTSAIGSSSHAEGYITIAQGDMSHAEGALTKAIGSHSHTEGSNNTTNAGNSHAEGANNTVNNSKYTAPSGGSSGSTGSTEPSEPADFNIEEHYGEGGHAEGMYNNAYGYASHAEGAHNKSKAHYSHTEGQGNDASGEGAHAEGWGTIASGAHSHSEGQGTKAIGDNAHAEGNGSKATGSGSHAEGSGTAQGDNAHAEGASIANNSNAHAEGLSTTASGNGAHSEGNYAQATNNAAHAEGVHTTANGDGSHTEGWYTTAKNRAEHAEGFFNFSNSVSPSYYTEGNNTLHSVGIGTSDTNRKNAFEVMQNGDIYAYGVGGYDGTNAVNNASKTLKTVIESKQDKLVSGTNIKTVNGTSLLGSGNITISGGSGDITAAGNNTFTGNNTFSGETIIKNNIVFNSDGNGNIEVEQIPIGLQLGSNGSEIIVSGVATPVDTLDAANKKYVDDQITAKLGTVLTQLQNI